jgi:TPR repeat protein
MARDDLTPDRFIRFLRQAEAGDWTAQYTVGSAYAEGNGVKQSYPDALKWLHKAAEQGHTLAQADLGSLYAEGFQDKSAWFFQRNAGVDRAEAYKWFRLALQGGYVPSIKQAALIKQLMPAAELKAAEQHFREINRPQLANRPFTERLLKLAAQRRERFGEPAGRMPWETLDSEVDLATVLVTNEITMDAASAIFGSRFRSEDNLLSYIVFALMVLSSIITRIEAEGHKPSTDLQFQGVFGLLDVVNYSDVMTIVTQAQQYIQNLTGRQSDPNVNSG